ncbi:putative DNA binding domain-containing protein [candidate division KSB1 bacterium]|nr:putative DNA binding domain-containing protein [candidate division KSB1 bacterium]
MDAEALRQRLRGGENLTTEFKVASIHPDDLAASLVAFANTSGGEIIFGVNDKGEIVGIENIDALGKFIDNVSRDKCVPAVTILPEKIEIEGKTLLVVNIPQGDERPYSTNRGVHYIRTFSGRRQASREELLRIFQAAQSLFYEENPVSRADLTALDYSYFEYFLMRAYGRKLEDFDVSKEQLLANLRLAKDGHPTVAGVLLFGRDPQALLPYAQINAAQFSGTDVVDAPADRKDITGKLADQLEGAMRFLNVHLRVRHEIKGFEPERFPELPEEALRETLVNALMHRDYTIRGPVRLFVFQDRVEVHSPGKPPNTVDVATMRLGTHVPRNPILLSHFAKLGYVTSLGTGVPRVIRLVSQAVGKEPDIAVRDFEVMVSIPRKQFSA